MEGDSQIRIGVSLNANTAAGADQAIGDIERLKAAEAEAAADARAAQIVAEYGVAAQTAARALELLGPAAEQASIGSAALEAAIETAQRETAELAAQQERGAAIAQEYNTSLQVVARALEMLGPAASAAAIGSAELEAALEAANIEIEAGNAAWRERLAVMQQSVAAEMEALAAEDAAAASGTTLAGVSDAVAAAMTRLGIAQIEVAATAQRMSVSLDVAARAMIQIKNAEIAAEVARVRIELAALASPALDAAAATESVGEAAVAAGAKTTNSFGRGSPAFHAMVAASNISRGGAIAMRGWMEAAELAGVAFGGIIGPVILVSAVVGEIVARYEEHNRKLREGKDGVDSLLSSWSPATAALTGYEDGLRSILRIQQDQLDADERMLSIARERAALLLTDARQEQEQRLQSLRGQYLQDQAKPQTDDQRKELKDRYEAARKDIEDGGVVNTALLEAVSMQGQIDTTAQKLADLKASNAADTLAAAEAFNRGEEARKRLEPYGIGLDKEGKKLTTDQGIDPIAKKEGEIAQAETYRQRRYNEYGVGEEPERAVAMKESDAELKKLRGERDQLSSDLATLIKEAETEKTLGSKLPEQRDAISKLQDQLANLQEQLPQKEKAVDLAVTNKKQDESQAGVDADERAKIEAKRKATEDFDIRDAQRYAQRKKYESQAEDPLATPDQQAAAKAAADQIDASSIADKIVHAIALGISQTDLTKLRADLAADQAKGGFVVEEQHKKDQGAQDKASQKQEEIQIKAATESIEKSGNTAAIGQLQAVLSSHLSELQQLPILMQIIAQSHLKLQSEVSDLSATVSRLKHP